MFVRELCDGQEIDQPLLVREREQGARRDGTTYLRLRLGDRTGAITAILREEVAECLGPCAPGSVVWVKGRYEVHPRYGPQVAVEALRAAREDECEPAHLEDGPPRSAELMEADLRELVATVQNPHLRALLDGLLGP